MTAFIQKHKPLVAEIWLVLLTLVKDKEIQQAFFANVGIWINFYFKYLT